MTLVVDASVALKWYQRGLDSDAALVLLGSDERMVAPDLTVAELCNAAWRLIRSRQMRLGQMRILSHGAPGHLRDCTTWRPLHPAQGRSLFRSITQCTIAFLWR